MQDAHEGGKSVMALHVHRRRRLPPPPLVPSEPMTLINEAAAHRRSIWSNRLRGESMEGESPRAEEPDLD